MVLYFASDFNHYSDGDNCIFSATSNYRQYCESVGALDNVYSVGFLICSEVIFSGVSVVLMHL
jgi:hypothetical protein